MTDWRAEIRAVARSTRPGRKRPSGSLPGRILLQKIPTKTIIAG
jgi:hypothetical protein